MKIAISLFWMGMLCAALQAQESDSAAAGSEENTAKKTGVIISGSGNLMFGQIVGGHTFAQGNSNYIEHRWLDFYGGNIIACARPAAWLTTKIGVDARSAFPVTSTNSIMKETYRISYRSFLPVAEGILHWNFKDKALPISSLVIESGIFPYTFSPDIKNFGNYLYRGGAYPLYLETKLDYPYYDMLGIRTEAGVLDNSLKIGAIVNGIINHAPFFDMSLALTASYASPHNVIDFGVGLCFDRIWSVNDYMTDCEAIKSNNPSFDSSWTLRSTKLDSRMTFDAKPLMGSPDFFGKQDAKVYGELAILGLSDPNYFHDSTFTPSLLHRMPILIGVNLPAFKILDLVSFEMEFFNSPYTNDWWGNDLQSPSPVPYDLSQMDSTWKENYKTKDNFKWTVYLKKSIGNYDIIGLFANDHMFYDTYSAESQPNTEQSLRSPKDWHWYIKLQYNF